MATLSQLLEVPGLGLRLVQAGAGEVELSWVSTTELLDLSAYLEGGEIVLTTGLALGSDDPRWLDFVASLSRAHVAAIGFGVGVNHNRIPAPLIAAASAYRLALVEVPPPTPFIAVGKAVAGLIQADELRAAHQALHIHQRLLEGARGRQSQAEVLASISQATGRHLALIDADGIRLASTGGFVHAESNDEIPLDTTNSGIRLEIAAGDPLGPEGRAVLTAGAMVLGLEVRGARNEEQRERDRWARLAKSLMDGTVPPEALSILLENSAPPESVRAIAVRGSAEDVSAWRTEQRMGIDQLVTAADPAQVPGIAVAWQLSPESRSSVERNLATIARHRLDAVVGRPNSLADSGLSRRSTLLGLRELPSLDVLYKAPRQPQVIWVDRGSTFLAAALAGDDAEQLSRAVLAPLLAEQDHATLLSTVQAVLSHGGARGPAATELGIHRNTLRDRVHRVEVLTGRSVDQADDRAELWLALRVRDALTH